MPWLRKGLIQKMPETVRFIDARWVPRSGSRIRKAPHFELQDSRFVHDSPESELDIYIRLV